jgi:cytochrome c553
MFYRCCRRFMALLLVLGLALALPSPAAAETNPAELAQAIEAIENLDAMRSGLASTLEGRTEPPTMETMKQVCKPVGMRAKQLSQERGWQVKQVASKYRNPDHAPATPAESMALAKFEQDPELTGFWQRDMVNNQAGTHYFRRINVEASCLACHGRKGDRPQFVQERYPQDLAYDFNPGDLRGMYAVFLPDVQQALEAALSES